MNRRPAPSKRTIKPLAPGRRFESGSRAMHGRSARLLAFMFAVAVATFLGLSSNGRTSGFEPERGGSNPPGPVPVTLTSSTTPGLSHGAANLTPDDGSKVLASRGDVTTIPATFNYGSNVGGSVACNEVASAASEVAECALRAGLRTQQATPATPPPDCGCEIPPPVWTLWAQQKGASQDTLELLTTIGNEYARDGVDMPCLLACIAAPESSFNPASCGNVGERGLIQINPNHKASMHRAGLDFNCEADRLRYGCLLITAAIDSGKGLRRALQPWRNTRNEALDQYYALLSSEWGTE